MEERIENCRISSTMLGIEDHGMMTFYVFLDGDGWGQGLGGYALDAHDRASKEKYPHDRSGWGPAIIAIRRILETVGVEKWEDLKGQLCRAKVYGLGSSRTPIIGNIIKDKWFDLKEFSENHK